MKTDKLIIFDWGGVIESHDDKENSIKKTTLALFKSFQIDLDDNIILEKYLACCNNLENQGDANELFTKIKKTFNIECTIDEFIKRYNEYTFKTEFYKEVVTYVHSLKSRCKIGILSNLNPFDKERLNYQVDLSKFDYIWLSFELDCMKPNPKIYDIVENELSISQENILFIDDLEKNLEIPKMRGWQTCNSTGLELNKIKESVEEFLQI